MPSAIRPRLGFLLAGATLVSATASAQDRTDDNAITQAEDAFGFSVGRESIGIYNAGQARGFSPTQAGNVRIDGLYFDPANGLQGMLIESTSIKVGLSAQGYPFVAPSGIVDQSLRRPDQEAGASAIIAADSWGGYSAELTGSLPVTDRLSIYGGVNAGAQEFPNGTNNKNYTASLLARWRPTDKVEIVPFWARFDDTEDEIGTFYIPAGNFIPPVTRPRHDESPKWADIRFTGQNAGLVASVGFGPNWVARIGAFRSEISFKHGFAFLMTDVQPDGTGERILFADPPNRNRSLSGELRVTRSIADGPRLHVIHVSARKRDARREFGGADTVSFGIGRIGEHVTDPRPEFEFGEQTRQRVQQMTYGAAYNGRWRDVGEISFGLSRAYYEKVTRIPLVDPVEAESSPWLYNGTAALILSKAVSVYAGYARGLEESGTAPFSAANRNEPLDTILTEQKDAGIRVTIAEGITGVAGVFDLTRPYFGFDSENVFKRIGTIRSRGAEFSISGRVTPKLNLVLGGVLLKPKVEAQADAQGSIGSRPVGLPTHIVNFNANWETPLKGVQLDAGISHRGEQPTTTDNLVFMPSRLNINLGGRYGFSLAGKTASLRIQATNALDNNLPTSAGPGIYGARGSRQVLGFLTVDF